MLSKYLKMTSLLLVLALSVTACGKKKNSEAVGAARTAGRVTGSGVVATNTMSGTYQTNIWNAVTVDRQYQDSFQEMIKVLVAPGIDPAAIGYVSADASNNTGVFMNAFIDLNADRSINASTSMLKIMIQDEFVGQKDDSGKEILPYPIIIPGIATSSVTPSTSLPGANDITITFRDSIGEITLVGTLSSNTYSGKVKFKNNAPKGDGKEYWLGGFNAQMCSMFNCK